MVLLVPGKEVEEERRLRKAPLLALAKAEHITEELLGLLAVEEVCLIRRTLVSVARRSHNPVHTHRHHFIKEVGHTLRVCPIKHGAVDGHTEAARLGLFNGCNRTFVHTILADGGIMLGFVAIQMHIP